MDRVESFERRSYPGSNMAVVMKQLVGYDEPLNMCSEEDGGNVMVRREVRRTDFMVHGGHDDRATPHFRNRKGRGPHKGPYDRCRRDRQRGNHSGGLGGPGPWLMLEDGSQDNSSQNSFKPYRRPFRKGAGRFKIDRRQGKGGGRGGPVRGGDRGGSEVKVLAIESAPPSFLLSDLKPEHLEHLKQCMAKRFDGSQQALDLSSIQTDPDLVSQNIDVILSSKSNMEAVIKIIAENIRELTSLNLSNNRIHKLGELAELVTKVPHLKTLNLSRNELKSDRELDKVKGLKLVELCLSGNPLCDFFKDQASYISAVRQRFPRLLKLDGHDLPPPIGFDVETPTTIPPCKGSYIGPDEIKPIIHRFLRDYYTVYDSGDRQPLLDAYFDGASLSVTTPDSRRGLGAYYKASRNLKTVKDSTRRFELLKHTRLNVVAFLNQLPKTQHDLNSFTIDVNTYTNTLLLFTVSGVFKEVDVVDGKSRESTMAFSRVFITVPATNSGLCILNDQLTVRMATTEEIRRAFAAPAPTPCSSLVPTLSSAQRQEMLTQFSHKSGMNLEWSHKCLQDNQWDFSRAAHIFTQMKAKGMIPQVAFI